MQLNEIKGEKYLLVLWFCTVHSTEQHKICDTCVDYCSILCNLNTILPCSDL